MSASVDEQTASQAQVVNPKLLEARCLIRDCLRDIDPKSVVVTIRRAFEDRIAEMEKDFADWDVHQDKSRSGYFNAFSNRDGKIRGMKWWRALLDA